MGDFTKSHHKSMAKLQNGETIFGRQIRILSDLGILEFIVTTGPFADQLQEVSRQKEFEGLSFTFVPNPVYNQTNYIYSMYLAREFLSDDLLLLHGDLVFNKRLAERLLKDPTPDLAMVNCKKPLPEKDFKARIQDGRIQEVSIHIFNSDCFAFQPLYKLSRGTIGAWVRKVSDFIAAGNDKVYAENALNEILPELNIRAFSYAEEYIDEVDNLADLARVSSEIRQFDFDGQEIAAGRSAYQKIEEILLKNHVKHPFLVCGHSFDRTFLREYLDELPFSFVKFQAFSPNPKLEEVSAGVELFRKENCDFILSVGGGSAMDTAKSIQLFSALPAEEDYIRASYDYTPVRHLAVPTTAGTGSESTRFSVIYVNGEKCSVTHDCIFPAYVVLEPRLLESLPEFQKKATLLDALCQCIEAIWSVNSNEKCRSYAEKGMQLLLENWESYLQGDSRSFEKILLGANLSGRAINISQTTAAHAMSYKMTSLYGIPHGYAVALCLPHVWRYLLSHRAEAVTAPGHLTSAFDFYAQVFRAENAEHAVAVFEDMLQAMRLPKPELGAPENLKRLTDAVNPERLGNSPVPMNRDAVRKLYQDFFSAAETAKSF